MKRDVCFFFLAGQSEPQEMSPFLGYERLFPFFFWWQSSTGKCKGKAAGCRSGPQILALLSQQALTNLQLPVFGEPFLVQQVLPPSFPGERNGLNQ